MTEAASETSNDDDAQIKLDTDTVLVTPCTWYSVSVSQYLSGGTNFQLDDAIIAFLCLEAKNWTYLEGGEEFKFKFSSIYKYSKNGQPRNKTYDLLQNWTVASAPFSKGFVWIDISVLLVPNGYRGSELFLLFQCNMVTCEELLERLQHKNRGWH